MAEEFATWTTLCCPECDSDRFVRILQLITRVNGGTTETPVGWECCGCRSPVDIGAMQQAASLRQLEQQIVERKAMMAALRNTQTPAQRATSSVTSSPT